MTPLVCMRSSLSTKAYSKYLKFRLILIMSLCLYASSAYLVSMRAWKDTLSLTRGMCLANTDIGNTLRCCL